jgi:hypothetical protein
MQITANGVIFHVDSQGFGPHAESAAAVVKRLESALAEFQPQQLGNPDLLDDVVQQVVQHETATWRCWRPGYRGELPRVVLRRVGV